MIRKMLLIATAVAMPLGATAVTAVAGSTSAGAASVPIVCHPTVPFSLVTYAAPGLSQAGSFSASPTSTVNTGSQNLGCGSAGPAHINPQSLTTANTQCTGTNTPVVGCSAGMYSYDSIGGFAGNASTLWSSLVTLVYTINGASYTETNSSSNAAAGCLAVGEVGFTIHGTITAGPAARMGHAAKYVACLGADTGGGTSGSTTADLGNPAFTGHIVTSAIDANSKIRIA